MLRPISILELAEITEGILLTGNQNKIIRKIAIDSRQISNPQETLFVALKGAKVDGQSFIPHLVKEGVSTFLVHKGFDVYPFSDEEVSFIEVADTREGLQKIALFERAEFKNPVIGITGSNGKTIIKEWLGQVLSEEYSVAKSPKSYNSQVGVPLSVFGIKDYHQVAILEAGVSKTGEMSVLKNIIRPDLGIFTNIGQAHAEGFESKKLKIQEKLLLFESCKYLVYCSDHTELSAEIEDTVPEKKRIAWSDTPGSDYVRSLKILEDSSRVILMKKDLSLLTFLVPFTDVASLENLTHVIIACLTLGQQPKSIQEGLSYLRPVDMRLTVKAGLNESILIDDTYSNDLEGLRVALDFMNLQRPKKRKILIVSDLLQQRASEKVYQEVAHLIHQHGIDLIFAVGKEVKRLKSLLKVEVSLFSTTEILLDFLQDFLVENDLILITGARMFGFERIVNQLQERIHGTTLEINLNALTHNYNFYKRQIPSDTKVMVMVKAFAYGGGAAEIANHLQAMGVDYLAVAFTDEGVSLREKGIHLPIMVLNPVKESLSLCMKYGLEPVIFSLDSFKEAATFISNKSGGLKIHLDFDTGMHRLGFMAKDLPELKALILDNPNLEVKSIYTHLAGADEEIHRDYSLSQLEEFIQMKTDLENVFDKKPLAHALNSAGILAFPANCFDMVRLGIGLYGVEVTGKRQKALLPVSSLKTTISQVKELASGSTIGYSRKGSLPHGGKIATLAIGYADGFDRRFSDGVGYVMIRGTKLPIIGNVCMDMCMVDLQGIDAKEGDEALIFGEQIPLAELALRIGTIPYELLTNISSRVKRVYYLD